MLKNILVPLDGSELAARALEHARKLVNHESRITLLMVIEPPEDPNYSSMYMGGGMPDVPIPASAVDYETMTEDMVAQARHYLQHVANELQQSGYQVEFNVSLGNPARTIVETAENIHCEAIIMSTHGRSGLSRWILGSVTHKVVNSAPCPVYVIPPVRLELSD